MGDTAGAKGRARRWDGWMDRGAGWGGGWRAASAQKPVAKITKRQSQGEKTCIIQLVVRDGRLGRYSKLFAHQQEFQKAHPREFC